MNTILISEMEKIRTILGEQLNTLCNKSVLVTGATGLIGSYVVDFLVYMNTQYNMDIHITAVATNKNRLKSRFGKHKNLKFIQSNLDVPGTFKSRQKFDMIIHAACPTDPKIYADAPADIIKTNVIGTIQMLDVARKSNARFLFVSSGEVYGHNTDHIFTEKDTLNVDARTTRACYPASKITAEVLCQSYAQMYNMHINIVRPCFVYGPNIGRAAARVNAMFLKAAINKKNIVLNSAGNQMRSWCHVADAAGAILCVLLNAPCGDVYNIVGKNSNATIYQFACQLAQITNVNVEMPTNCKKIYGADSVISGRKITKLGWKPQYDLKNGLKHTVDIESLTCIFPK